MNSFPKCEINLLFLSLLIFKIMTVLLQVFEQYEPVIVYHAAAHKHRVPRWNAIPKKLQEQYPLNILLSAGS